VGRTFYRLAESNTDPQSATLKNKSEILRQTWRLLMENYPHDSICSCLIDQVHEEMKVRSDQMEQICKEITLQTLESLVASVKPDCAPKYPSFDQSFLVHDLSSIIVFNPTSSSRIDVVTAIVELPADVTKFVLLDDKNISLPYQKR
jgi:hypothetical protein